jgi:outer membrane protein, heavy metal efflux system
VTPFPLSLVWDTLKMVDRKLGLKYCFAIALSAMIALLTQTEAWAQAAPPGTIVETSELFISPARKILREMALRSNRDIQAARLDLDSARAEVQRVDVSPNPTLFMQAANTEANRYRYGTTDRIVRLEQTFERGNKRGLRREQAQFLAIDAQARLQDAIRQQWGALDSAFFDVALAQRQALSNRELIQANEYLLQATKKRLSAGDVARLDVQRLELELQRALNEGASLQTQINQSVLQLAQIIGEPAPGALTQSAEQELVLDPATLLQITRQVLAGSALRQAQVRSERADIRAVLARIEAARRAVTLAQSQRSRDLTLGVQAERAPSFGGSVVGISASVPLFINNDFSGEIARAQAELRSAQFELERQQALIDLEIARTREQVQSASQRAERLLRNTAPAAQEVVKSIEFAYQRGAASLTDVFDARRQLSIVNAELALASAQWAQAVSALESALSLESFQ